MSIATRMKPTTTSRTNAEVRAKILQCIFDRSENATSTRGKKGFAFKINFIHKELKARQGLTQEEVVGPQLSNQPGLDCRT